MSQKQCGGVTDKADVEGVEVTVKANEVLLNNGIVKLTFTKPGGSLKSVSYNDGMDNLLDPTERDVGRMYYDCNWKTGDQAIFTKFTGKEFKIAKSDKNGVEISFVQTYDGKGQDPPDIPLIVDMRYILLNCSHGFYTYAIYKTPPGSDWPAFTMVQTRAVFKLNVMFDYMFLTNDRQRYMPSKLDLRPDRSAATDIAEARVLTNPANPSLKGELDDKYHSCMDNKDCRMHGWVSGKGIGFWIVNMSDEYCSGGPGKTNLTSHTGPISLRMFHSGHNAPPSIAAVFEKGEQWTKVYGPFCVYLNKGPPGDAKCQGQALWKDANEQMEVETKSWPPAWPESRDFPKANERGSVAGVLRVQDPFSSTPGKVRAKNAYVGLSAKGGEGAWVTESKGYQFWTQSNELGEFTIQNVHEGEYDLFAWVPGYMGDFKRKEGSIKVERGIKIKLGDVVYNPPRYGPTLWEIGYPDREASGFVPDPDPKFTDRLYLRDPTQSFRQYGLWARYSVAFPKQDLVYDVNKGDWKKDWWFAHFCRDDGKGGWLPTTWEIKFDIPTITPNSIYKLWIVFAAYGYAAVQVRVNDVNSKNPLAESKSTERDNVIPRAANHGVYFVWPVDIPSSTLRPGMNSIFLTQRVARGYANGVMYDYLRLEGPPRPPRVPESVCS